MKSVQMQSCCRTTRIGSARAPAGARPFAAKSLGKPLPLRHLRQQVQASADPDTDAAQGSMLENPDSEFARKKATADELREQEKYMTIGTGEAECKGCGYVYDPKKGDPEYPIAKGTQFTNVPADWQCPVCGAEKNFFENRQKEVAGFAANQGYGLGTNSMTAGQKSALIYGSLLLFFVLFLLGYTLE